MDKIKKIADFLDVPSDYIMNGIPEDKKDGLSTKDERDIAKNLEKLMEKLNNKKDGPASFEGTDIPEEDQELFAGQLELMLRKLKVINKEKYNPNKNKK